MAPRAYRMVALVAWLPAALALALGCGQRKEPPPEPPAAQPAEADDVWLRPEGERPDPVWGVKGGLSVSLWPTGGPRGLIRVYAPYLGQRFPRMVNFIS